MKDKPISNKRRALLKGSAVGASAAAFGFPSFFVKNASAAAPLIKQSKLDCFGPQLEI